MSRSEPLYTVAMCNYNMENTLKTAARSIIEQLDNEYELFVVDDGSTDDSVAILDQLSDELERVRYAALDRDPSRKLGATRNISVREARGEYVLPQFDADDRYDRLEGGIEAFTTLYHEIESELGSEFYLSGRKMHIGEKSFLLEHGPYRNLPPGAEDWDLWRRLHASNEIIFVTHRKNYEPNIGHHKSVHDRLRRSFTSKVGDFQTGITLRSYMRWNWETGSVVKFPYHIGANILAYLLAKRERQFESPPSVRDIYRAHTTIRAEKHRTISDIEEEYDIQIDRDAFSEVGKDMFLNV